MIAWQFIIFRTSGQVRVKELQLFEKILLVLLFALHYFKFNNNP